MTKVTPTAGSRSEGGFSSEEGPLRPEEDREESKPDPAALSGAAAQASYRLQRLEGASSPQDPASDPSLTPVGTLNVGDSYASDRLNSPATAEAARRGVSATDRLSLEVPPQAPPPSAPPTPSLQPPPRTEHQPLAFYSTSSGYVSFPLQIFGGEEDEEEMQRRMATLGQGSAGPLPTTGPPPGASPTPSSPASTGSQRYVFAVRDVHSMGGTPSSLSIRDGSGNMVGRYEFQPGNSKLTVDLPPGSYTVEAQSGSRSVGGGGDQLDNFRVEVYSAGPTPAGGSGGSGGSSAGGSGGGASPQ